MIKACLSILFLLLIICNHTWGESSDSRSDIQQKEEIGSMADSTVKVSELYYFTDNDTAMFFLDSALKLYVGINDKKGQMMCLSKLSVLHHNKGRVDTAFALAYKAVEIGEKLNYDTLLAETYIRLGNIYSSIGKYKKARVFYNKTIIINLPNTIHGAFGALGDLYMQNGDLDSARYYLNRSLEYYKSRDTLSVRVLYNLSSLYGTLGIVSFEENKPQEGLWNFKESMRLSKKIGNEFNIITSLLNLSIAYDIVGQPGKSEGVLMNALQMTDTLGFDKLRLKVYKLLSEHYIEREEYKPAYNYSAIYHSLKDSLDKDNNDRKIYEKELEYISRIQEEELKTLAAEKEKNRIIYFFIIAALSFLFILLTIFLYRKVHLKTKEKKRLEDESKLLTSNIDRAKNNISNLNQHLSEQNKLIVKLENEITNCKSSNLDNGIKDLAKMKILHNEDWEEYMKVFQSLHPNFFAVIESKYSQLTEGEKRQIIMIKLNYSRKKSAQILGISPESVKRARQRLSKKLGFVGVIEMNNIILLQ